MFDYVISKYFLINISEPAVNPLGAKDGLDLPTKLVWDIDEDIEKHIAVAEKTALELINDTESCLIQTDLYGSRFIKEIAKCSPDAYIQLVLQLAYWRVHQNVTAVYESASTRLFKHGRTETVRSMSSDSLAFIKAFDDDEVLVRFFYLIVV
jgi:carnitine O-acetyltransferase